MIKKLPNDYKEFIEKCKMKDYGNLHTHKHHILPKFMGGDDSDDNLVTLSIRDHYEAHKLLAETCESKYKYGNLMSATFLINRYSDFDISKEEISKLHSKGIKEYLKNNKPQRLGKTGYKFTPEHSVKMSASLSKYYQNNPTWNLGKQCDNISKSLKEWHSLNDNPFKDKIHTEKTKRKMSENHANVNGDKNPASRPCIDLGTGITYGCIKELAKSVGVPKSTMSRWIRDKRKLQYKYISYE